jgi:mono/diheme cytochrome c family protein
LRPEYVFSVITNPRTMTPHSIMPKIPMTPDTAQLIASFLLQQDETARPARYLSPVDSPLIPFTDGTGSPDANTTARNNYLSHCAACHGSEGQGNGFNARFLPVKPTMHADPVAMSGRPDATLYDGIHSGGYILNKSHLMPPWGQSLAPKEVNDLVRYIRTLCRCQGPAWSRDNEAK